jgi:putative lipase involved disintegration of autophagic bodies
LAENVGMHGKNEKCIQRFGHKISQDRVEYLGVNVCGEYKKGFSRNRACENGDRISLAQGIVKAAMYPLVSATARNL